MRGLLTFMLPLCALGVSCAPEEGSLAEPTVLTPTPSAPTVADADTVVASWSGGEYRYGDLESDAKGRLLKMEVDYLTQRYETMRAVLEQKVAGDLLEEEAKSRGLADSAALIKAMEESVSRPSDSEVKAFYEANKRRFRNRSLEDIRDAVEDLVLKQKQKEAYDTLLTELKDKANVEIHLGPPELPRLDVGIGTSYPMGPDDAPVTIVEFADFECGYCSRGHRTMKEIMEEYSGEVRWVYRDYPLSFHRKALPAAVSARCAGDQGKYWEMHDLLYQNQRELDSEHLETYASQLGLDMDSWRTCMDDETQRKNVLTDMSDGAELGVSGTPAYFINGIMLSGARPIEDFRAIIDRELEAAGRR